MVHPRELLRVDSVREREFSAPANIFDVNPIDCGIVQLPCLNNLLRLERFARIKVFVACLSLAALLQGASLTYFRNTAHIWSEYYHIPVEHIDWLIYTNEFFVGLFALSVAYWGNRIHRMSWLGGLIIFQSINALVLIVPEAYRTQYKHVSNTTIINLNLCWLDKLDLHEDDTNFIAYVLIVVYQIFFSLASNSFISHGITYMDDNTSKHHSPGYIGVVLAARELGKQCGNYLSGIPILLNMNSVFISIAWILLGALTFFTGTIIAMFPQSLPAIVGKRMSASIVDMVANQNYNIPRRALDNFLPTIARLLRNKVLMLNILAAIFLQTALINFDIFEKYFNQSRFAVSARVEDTIPLLLNMLKQPLVAITLVAAGVVVAKTRPRPKSLLKWNIAVLALVIVIFSSTAFFKCNQNIESTAIYCSSGCKCAHSDFQPVCINQKTYFSPCWAGCTSYIDESFSERIYTECSCGGRNYQKGHYNATEGSCTWKSDGSRCTIFWIAAQANSVLLAALLQTILITNLMINMRCILPRDKAVALGLETTFTVLIPYLPMKQIYDAVGRKFCETAGNHGKCNHYSEEFALFLSIITISLIVISLIVTIVLHFIVKEKHFAKKEDAYDDDSEHEMQEIQDRPEELAELRHDSLEEMENVGDDHDSIGSIDFHSNRQNRRHDNNYR